MSSGSTMTMACDCPSLEESCIDYIVSLCVIGSAFIISEVLPFLRQTEGNGLSDCLIKTFQTSECCLSKLLECLGEKKRDSTEANVEMTTSLKTKQAQDVSNAININIGDVKHTESVR